jgi:ferredoxin
VTAVTVARDSRHATKITGSALAENPHRSHFPAGAHLPVIEITALPPIAFLDSFLSGYIHFTLGDRFIMAYVITDTCIKDSLCVDVCPTDCIHPKQDEPEFEASTQMYVDPEGCIDCGACVPACGSDSIHALEDVPEEKKEFVEKNAAYYKH